MQSGPYFLGLDFGTSGARCTVIDDEGGSVLSLKRGYAAGPSQTPWHVTWESVLFELTNAVPPEVRSHITALAIDGTSATALLLDRDSGEVLAPVKLYDEAQVPEAVQLAKAMAPAAHTATASTSTLCKLLAWWFLDTAWRQRPAGATPVTTSGAAPDTTPDDAPSVSAAAAASASAAATADAPVDGPSACLLHQADWVASLLHGRRDVTDWNNALKLGYDPGAEEYPGWLAKQPFADLLPATVVPPGAPVSRLSSVGAKRSGLPAECIVCGGTTDSIAAFVAAGVSSPGQAVTSLGSTLAVKLLSTQRVDDASYGVYSHRLGDAWLVGGASNTGGAVLRKYFTDDELVTLTASVDASRPSGLDYYPLVKQGERFPVNDPALAPRLEPRPADDALFLQGILEGMATIEARAFALLSRLGATPVTEVVTAGGGAVNAQWTVMRSRALGGVPVRAAQQGEASYGAALLARQGARSLVQGACLPE